MIKDDSLTVQYPEDILKVAEGLREEGRQEILREIAAMEPTSPCDSYCTFCRALLKYHDPTCLWLRASQVPK